ncbi:TPA: hypothetical protein ACH3X1_009052 [Trebouxia sp. C0004]
MRREQDSRQYRHKRFCAVKTCTLQATAKGWRFAKELMASAVQKHNKLSKNRRLPGGEQQQVVTMAKFQLNPMHLLVQQAYFSAKKQLFDKEAWVHDYFQLASEDTQKQLTQYLAMDMPPQLQGAAQTERLAWLTTQASHEPVAFVDTISQRLSGYDMTSGLQDANTAAEIMTQFRDSKNHNLEQWSDPSTALANFDALCDALGLARQACAADSNHLVCATLAVVDQAKGRQPSQDGYEQARVTMEHKNWKGLDGDRPAFLTSADDEAYMLRRTAIVTEQCLHLFDLDASPPVCSVYSPFALHRGNSFSVRTMPEPRPRSSCCRPRARTLSQS